MHKVLSMVVNTLVVEEILAQKSGWESNLNVEKQKNVRITMR